MYILEQKREREKEGVGERGREGERVYIFWTLYTHTHKEMACTHNVWKEVCVCKQSK